MKKGNKILGSLILLSILAQNVRCTNFTKYPLLMPNVRPHQPESYLCTPVKVNASQSYYIVGFEPHASMNVAHHMLLYGCTTPGSAKPVWNCGEMSQSKNHGQDTVSPCRTGSEIIYAWARDAPELDLPEEVGFKVGKGSTTRYLVLQVHYAHIDHFKNGKTDDSGIILHYTTKPQEKLAGVFLLGTAGYIPPRAVEYMESACVLTEKKTIHPFAYRVHTHSLGKIVSGYVIKANNTWIELGKRDPLTPQMFYPTHSNVALTKGDFLAARCTMQSTRERITYIGATNDDEMCNFYLMYWVHNEEPLQKKYCFTSGPPRFYWKSAGLEGIPDREASTL